MMRISERGLRFIEENEGLLLIPKKDLDKWSWGYGHDQQPGETIPWSGITQGTAEALLRMDLYTRFEPHVQKLAPWANQNQYDALCDFCYNCGPDHLAVMLHHGQSEVTKRMLDWCYAGGSVCPGLLARRNKEVALFSSL